MSTLRILRRFWGFESLRPLQADVIQAAIEKKDALVVMPTGGGKSLCYQVPPMLDDSLTVVVSPLISLMKDQVDGLKLIGYPAAALNSGIGADEEQEIRRMVGRGKIRLLYLSPERILTGGTLSMLQEANDGRGVERIAIDEAHCISQWGHDFRPEYRQLVRLRKLFPTASFHALTATATPKVRDDIAAQLGLKSPQVFVGTFDRPNLTYRIVAKIDPVSQIEEAVKKHPNDASIIYCISRKETEQVADSLIARGVKAVAYHARLDNSKRQKISEQFAREQVNVVVATVAFGMGIDRSNVRLVVHASLPKSIEGYQQETGRAGRDGLPSECIMLYDPRDVMGWERVISKDASPDHLPHQLAMIDEVRRFAIGRQCRHQYLSGYFGQEHPGNCGACDMCLDGWKKLENATRFAQQIIATVNDLTKKHGEFGFGAAHIAGILKGANTKQIRERGHNELRGYGAMKDRTTDIIQTWIHQLVDLGLLERSGGSFPVVRVTARGAEAFRAREEIVLRDVDLPERESDKSSALPSTYDDALFEALRSVRREIAEERQAPAYMIFGDATLIALASYRPTSREMLLQMPGVGEKRADDLGEAFLACIRSHVEARGLTHDLESKPLPPKAKSNRRAGREDELRPMFEEGMSVDEIAKRVNLSPSTVGRYLGDWAVTSGADLRRWVDLETEQKIRKAFRMLGSDRLAPIYNNFNGDISYETLHVVRAYVVEGRTLEE